MVLSGISLAYYTVGNGENLLLVLVSVCSLLFSLYFSLLKIPNWFCAAATADKSNSE